MIQNLKTTLNGIFFVLRVHVMEQTLCLHNKYF